MTLPPPPRSVPSGRVGSGKDSVFRSNEDFRAAVMEREAQDVAEVEAKLGRRWGTGRGGGQLHAHTHTNTYRHTINTLNTLSTSRCCLTTIDYLF